MQDHRSRAAHQAEITAHEPLTNHEQHIRHASTPLREQVHVFGPDFSHLWAWRTFSLLDAEYSVYGLKCLLGWSVMNWNSWRCSDIRILDEQGREILCAIDDVVPLRDGQRFTMEIAPTRTEREERQQARAAGDEAVPDEAARDEAVPAQPAAQPVAAPLRLVRR